jgi:Ca-activated chloride channel family protein
LKAFIYIAILQMTCLPVCAQQYYVRGEVKDESGNALQNVNILQHKTGYVFRSGATGNFGILAQQQTDTLSFSSEGYCTQRLLVNADIYQSIRMKRLQSGISAIRRGKLASYTQNLEKEEQKNWYTGDETYASLLENHFVNAKKTPVTGMSLNVDRASYSNIRRFITQNAEVPPDAVRIEEMLNYFNLGYTEPADENMFHLKTTLTECPWNPDNQLFYVNLSSKKLDLDTLPPSHLVFLIDVSGSMDMPNRLPLLQSAFRLLVNNLRDKDSVAIVVYGGITGVMLNTTSGGEKEKILKIIDELQPGGATPGESGIKLAYSVARNHFIKEGNNRVILATDGDFNVGVKTDDELDELISAQRLSGIYLTCLGVGMGNYKDSKIQTLATKGNGNFAYLDNFQEAEKVLLKEFTQTLYAVADNVYMSVEFKPEFVKEYRLIGFDNKVGVLKDTLAVVEGGEVGSGYSMMALFEIIPSEVNRSALKENFTDGRLAEVKLTYELPGKDSLNLQSFSSKLEFIDFEAMPKCQQFSATVAMFGSLLRGSQFVKGNRWNEVINLAGSSYDSKDLLQKEFVSLLQKTKALYTKNKKKKNESRND